MYEGNFSSATEFIVSRSEAGGRWMSGKVDRTDTYHGLRRIVAEL
jgi:hypothetical protein